MWAETAVKWIYIDSKALQIQLDCGQNISRNLPKIIHADLLYRCMTVTVLPIWTIAYQVVESSGA